MRQWFPLIKFVGDFCISAAMAVIVFRFEWGYVVAHGEFFALLIMAPPALFVCLLLLAAPYIAVLIYGLAKTRFGLVLGPILAAVTTYGLHTSAIKQEDQVLEQKRADIAQLASSMAEPLRENHTLLAVDEDGGTTTCDDNCIKVLATTTHTLAFRSFRGDHKWMVYAQAGGLECLAKENAKLALQFLVRGFPDKCATQTPAADLEDALLLRITWSGGRSLQLAPEMPVGFDGARYETIERVDRHDRTLARYFQGYLKSELFRFPLWKQPPVIKAGIPIYRLQFLAAAIGGDIRSFETTINPFPYDEVLTGIERYFDLKETIDADTFRSARSSWSQIASSAARPQARLLREHILRLFATRDPLRIELGLKAMPGIRLEERDFPDDVMIALMFVPMNTEAIPLLEKQLERQFAPPRKPPAADVQEQAKAHLNDPNLQPWQSRILNQVTQFQ